MIETVARQITAVERYEVINLPKWSPDGSMIAVATWSSRMTTDMAHPSVAIIDARAPHRTLLSGLDRVLAWEPSGCCIATFGGYWADDIGLLDVATGEFRALVGDESDYPEGVGFREWSRDGLSIFATDDQHDPGGGWWVHRLLILETLDGTLTELALEGPDWAFDFGGFSPDGRQIVYGASEPSDSEFQLRIVDTAPGGRSHVGLDLTADLPRISSLTEGESLASWRQLRWSIYGIHGTVTHWHWPW